jgi:ATP-dependent exoDNAse (exonuclease V) alpha subunit
MPTYHATVKVVSRKEGRSATGAAAYRAGACIEDRRTGLVFDYTRKRDVVLTEILAPAGAPAWAQDRAELWNRVEEREDQWNSQLAREAELALPRELPPDERADLARRFVVERFVSAGMLADMCIHEGEASDGVVQPHAHVLLTMRRFEGDGFGGKERSWNPRFANTKGGHGFVADTSPLENLREKWADYVNHELERIGSTERVDHRSLAAQRAEALAQAQDPARSPEERQAAAIRAEALDREPQTKQGPKAAAMERKGTVTERGEELRAIKAGNRERDELRKEYAFLCETLGITPEAPATPNSFPAAAYVDPVRKVAHAALKEQREQEKRRHAMAERLKQQTVEKARDWRQAKAETTGPPAPKEARAEGKSKSKSKGKSKGSVQPPGVPGVPQSDKAEATRRRRAMLARLKRQAAEKRLDFGREH